LETWLQTPLNQLLNFNPEPVTVLAAVSKWRNKNEKQKRKKMLERN
jgi:hypothetical protein